MKKFTHFGYLVGCDNRTLPGTKFKIKLRETKNFWVTDKGIKYHKKDGWGIGDWPLYKLEISSISSIIAEIK